MPPNIICVSQSLCWTNLGLARDTKVTNIITYTWWMKLRKWCTEVFIKNSLELCSTCRTRVNKIQYYLYMKKRWRKLFSSLLYLHNKFCLNLFQFTCAYLLFSYSLLRMICIYMCISILVNWNNIKLISLPQVYIIWLPLELINSGEELKELRYGSGILTSNIFVWIESCHGIFPVSKVLEIVWMWVWNKCFGVKTENFD